MIFRRSSEVPEQSGYEAYRPWLRQDFEFGARTACGMNSSLEAARREKSTIFTHATSFPTG